MLDIDVAVTLGGFRQQTHEGLLAEMGKQGLRLTLRRGADEQADRGDVRGPMGERGPRDNRR
jgi:hypothetical protein